jgi:hypothetical protein
MILKSLLLKYLYDNRAIKTSVSVLGVTTAIKGDDGTQHEIHDSLTHSQGGLSPLS